MLRILFFATFTALVLGQSDEVAPGNGTEPETKIIGGIEAIANAWPWQASLKVWKNLRYIHVCGGVLIHTLWVLTTASCVNNNKIAGVVLGEHDLIFQSGREKIHKVSVTYSHPEWNGFIYNGKDIALVRLVLGAMLSYNIQLASLPSADQPVPCNAACYVTGWGLNFKLRVANLPIVDHYTCTSSSWWGSSVQRTMICAGGTGGAAACIGDGGGPLNCLVNGRYVVHGLFSFYSSSGCNTIRKPSVFTRVSSYIPWVRSFTG